jgi:hypothetical protein
MAIQNENGSSVKSGKAPILVIVHPGSACGSADFQIGKYDAEAARDGLRHQLDRWNGGVIVLEGEFDDELSDSWYSHLGESLSAVLARAKASGQVSLKRKASDPDQVSVIKNILKESTCSSDRFVVTGAWAYADGTGCVYSVLEALNSIGLNAEVSDMALSDR